MNLQSKQTTTCSDEGFLIPPKAKDEKKNVFQNASVCKHEFKRS